MVIDVRRFLKILTVCSVLGAFSNMYGMQEQGKDVVIHVRNEHGVAGQNSMLNDRARVLKNNILRVFQDDRSWRKTQDLLLERVSQVGKIADEELFLQSCDQIGREVELLAQL